mmetsp:Transcript_20634/g.58713  ORF Transcript_20634/g.58713 Transcript_20634/m.58713 type:complete len:113 (-) Transcript_20634:1136-1474(-)
MSWHDKTNEEQPETSHTANGDDDDDDYGNNDEIQNQQQHHECDEILNSTILRDAVPHFLLHPIRGIITIAVVASVFADTIGFHFRVHPNAALVQEEDGWLGCHPACDGNGHD